MNLQVTLLEKAAREDRLAHLLLFHGGSALLQEEAALRLAKILNCSRPASERPCQACQACQKINSGNHPDVLELKPQKTAAIGIEQVLIWQQKIYLKHYEGYYKISLLKQAESMTLAAANALLKVIEEPPERNVIILCSQNAEGILPTIRSRSQLVYFPDLTEETWLTGLEDADRQEALRAFHLSGENPNLAAEILVQGTAILENWIAKFRAAVREKSFLELYELFPIEKNQAALYLQVMAVQTRAGLQEGKICPEEFLAIGKAIEGLRKQVNPRLALEGLALELFQQGGTLCE